VTEGPRLGDDRLLGDDEDVIDLDNLPDASEMTTWQRYVLLLRALDGERQQEEQRTSVTRDDSASLTEELERLGPEVIDQGAELAELAVRLRLHRPRLTPITPADPPEAHDLVREATAAMHRSDNAGRQALDEASRPGFLPGWPPQLRNVLIYLGWAVVLLLLQWVFMATGSTSALVIWIVLPTVAFVGGWYTAGLAGRVRLSQQRVERSPRIGAALTYGVLPLVSVVMMIHGLVG
jgi:hypothetical protein